ncbi:unnamed protein product [Protopolystoma xenopodis]|uniref:Uncharacterized protein n=1 Tax=Protopolystoma xenopodis TaxID=117903 RepID=A0A3S4ZL14_9PLAT|nr:unnamed protein product [Protopolystoma xenopodis]
MAKQLLKDLDQRSSRARRLKARQQLEEQTAALLANRGLSPFSIRTGVNASGVSSSEPPSSVIIPRHNQSTPNTFAPNSADLSDKLSHASSSSTPLSNPIVSSASRTESRA